MVLRAAQVVCVCCGCTCDDVQSLRNTQVAEPRLCAPTELLYFLGEQSLMCVLLECCCLRAAASVLCGGLALLCVVFCVLCGVDDDAEKSILTLKRSSTALLPAVRRRR